MCGIGYAPIAPGTFGAAAGVAVYLAVVGAGAFALLAVAIVVTLLGIRACDVAERHFGRRDDGRIVVDEVAGQLVALAPLPFSADPREPLVLGAGFLAFRLFDIWKPGPVRAVERRVSGGLGVMCDDLVAGLLAALPVALLASGWIGWDGWPR